MAEAPDPQQPPTFAELLDHLQAQEKLLEEAKVYLDDLIKANWFGDFTGKLANKWGEDQLQTNINSVKAANRSMARVTTELEKAYQAIKADTAHAAAKPAEPRRTLTQPHTFDELLGDIQAQEQLMKNANVYLDRLRKVEWFGDDAIKFARKWEAKEMKKNVNFVKAATGSMTHVTSALKRAYEDMMVTGAAHATC